MKRFFLGMSAKALKGLHNLSKHTGSTLYVQPLTTGRFNAVLIEEDKNAH